MGSRQQITCPMPFYAFVQVMIIVPMGIVMYFVLAYQQRNWGLISQYRGQEKQTQGVLNANRV